MRREMGRELFDGELIRDVENEQGKEGCKRAVRDPFEYQVEVLFPRRR